VISDLVLEPELAAHPAITLKTPAGFFANSESIAETLSEAWHRSTTV